MADPINRLAMYPMPVSDDQVNMLVQPQLPPGHPSNMLMWLRDQIPQVQADDSSLASGIYSRLGRTATAIPRAGLETMANWLQGTHDPNAVRIGPDTIAPFGMFPMGMAGSAARGAVSAAGRSDAAIARDLASRYPDEIAGGSISRQSIAGGPRMGVVSDEGMTPLTLTRDAMHTPGDFVNRAPPLGRPANLMADNAKSSVPGTVVNAMGEQRTGTSPTTVQSAGASRRARTIDESVAEVRRILADTDPYDHYGVRVTQEPLEVGKRAPPSRIWDDGNPLDEYLPGSSARVFDIENPDSIWNAINGSANYDGDYVSVLGSTRREYGQDPGEIVMRDPTVLASYRRQPSWTQDAEGKWVKFDPDRSWVFADNAKSSVPGTAANSTQQDDSPVLSILSKYGLY